MAERTNVYDDIINLPRPVSGRHAPMSMIDRGAQFAPFAALVGFDSVLRESARLTEDERYLDEHSKELLDRKLRWIAEHPEEAGEITFLCFQQDAWKTGGSYESVSGIVKKIDLYRRTVFLESGKELEIESICAIEGECGGEF